MPNVPNNPAKTLQQVSPFLRPLVKQIIEAGAANNVSSAVQFLVSGKSLPKPSK